ncbi:MAG TPA: hypothetical protein VG452_06605 [Egibacteraceae bacterium]|nr:hypothetical protein [Egibacteraceae bacterium]
MGLAPDDGLRVVGEDAVTGPLDSSEDALPVEGGDDDGNRGDGDPELEALRDEFAAAFNARDLDAILDLVAADVECPDMTGDGSSVLAEELESIWERSPAAILTRAFLDGAPVAVGWLPDEDGCWSRAALVCFDAGGGLLTLVAMPDDADALDRAEADEPTGEELEEWSDWSEWDRGEETVARPRDRHRP